MDDILRVSNLSFYYQENGFFMKNVTFSVREGEIFGIIGPNGSGKTTLLRLITGYLNPSEGSIFLYGNDLRRIGIQKRAKTISVVPQNITTFFNFKVKEIVALGRLPYRRGTTFLEDEKIVRDAMEKAHILHLSDRKFFSLSGGERQRVLIAKSFAQKPRILLLDEFTSHLDIYHQKRIIDILLKEKGKNSLTILATFHDINLASILSDKILIMKNGKILSYGKPSDIINKDIIKETYSIDPIIGPHPKYNVPQIFYP